MTDADRANQDRTEERMTMAEERLAALEREVEMLREELRTATSLLATGSPPAPA